MAGKTGPEDEATAVPVEPVLSPEGEFLPRQDGTGSGDLSDGEPSGPQGVDPLRIEALFEDAFGAEDRSASRSEPVILSAGDEPADRSEKDEVSLTPGRAGPPWEWEAPVAVLPDRPMQDGEADAGSQAALSGGPEPLRPSPDSASAASVPPPRRRGGIGSLLLGGMIAAALGFGAAWVARDRLGPAALTLPADLEERLAALEASPPPDGTAVPALADRLTEVEARLQAIEDAPAPVASTSDAAPLPDAIAAGLAEAEARSADLEERLAALEARPVPAASAAPTPEAPGPAIRSTAAAGSAAPADLGPRLDEIEASLVAAQEALSGVDAALSTLEGRVGTNEAALAALGQQVAGNAAALQTADQRLTEVEAAGADAIAEARAAAASLSEAQARATAAETQARSEATLDALGAALGRGEPLAGPLADAESVGLAVPEPLARLAIEGVPTLAVLRQEFPDAARSGLAAAREGGLIDDGGILGFVRGQLSVRSTAPREGDDPDAVLSRAEAALSDGRLDAALAEVEALPEPVQTAMADWIAGARARAEAEAALATLRGAEPPAAPAN